MSTNRGPVWINPRNYRSITVRQNQKRILWKKWRWMLYEVTLPDSLPLTFLTRSGILLRMGHELTRRPFRSDKGSVPIVWRRTFPESQNERSYFHHDFICIFGGLFAFDPDMEIWEWMPIPREDGDLLLREMIEAEQEFLEIEPDSRDAKKDRAMIYRAVRIGSRWQGKTDSSGVEAW